MAGQLWATDTVGGFMSSRKLSKELRYAVQPTVKFRQFADIKDAIGKNKGDLHTWNVYSDVATQGTTLVETNTMPETNFTITQGTMTLTEFGNSVPYSAKLDNLSEHPVKEIINKVLANDAKKAFDYAAFAQFNLTPLRYVATTGTDTGTLYTNGTTTGTNTIAMQKGHVKDIVDKMKERNIPPYMADDYYAIAHPSTFRAFKNELESIHQYTQPGFQMIMNGEIGRYENTRFIEQTNITKAQMSISGSAWSQGKSNACFFFGADSVAEGVAVPEEIRGKIPSDYGRSKGVAWYALEGFAICHPFIATANAHANARIVKWDSLV